MGYSIGEVEDLTGIKPHVLRYWEEVLPGLSPKKDAGGRRLYSGRDLDLIQRMKFLVYTKGFTIEGARKQLVQDTTLDEQRTQTLMTIRQVKENLNELYLLLKRNHIISGKNNGTQK